MHHIFPCRVFHGFFMMNHDFVIGDENEIDDAKFNCVFFVFVHDNLKRPRPTFPPRAGGGSGNIVNPRELRILLWGKVVLGGA